MMNQTGATQKKFKETVFFAEPEFFDIFNFPFPRWQSKNCIVRTKYGSAYAGDSGEIFWRLAYSYW
jgi:hypothetical protein